MMERYPVSSSNVAAVGYDPVTQTLEVEFLTGSVYQYFDVPQAVYAELMSAPSKGECLHRTIKFSYRYARL